MAVLALAALSAAGQRGAAGLRAIRSRGPRLPARRSEQKASPRGATGAGSPPAADPDYRCTYPGPTQGGLWRQGEFTIAVLGCICAKQERRRCD